MMYIIKKTANENGSRPPLQIWTKQSIPNGYAICPDEFYDVFYSTSPAGFVNITVDNDIVASMEVNQTALNEYIASHKDTEPSEQEPTADEILNTLLGVA